jgi:hypothetical protein
MPPFRPRNSVIVAYESRYAFIAELQGGEIDERRCSTVEGRDHLLRNQVQPSLRVPDS